MDGDWSRTIRGQVIDAVFIVLCDALDVEAPPRSWWVTIRRIEDGSWGSRGSVTSIHDLLGIGVFSDAKIKAIRDAIPEPRA